MSDRIQCKCNKLSSGLLQFCVFAGNSNLISSNSMEAECIFSPENTIINPVLNVPVKKLTRAEATKQAKIEGKAAECRRKDGIAAH
jgi:hypothetical protein